MSLAPRGGEGTLHVMGVVGGALRRDVVDWAPERQSLATHQVQ